MHHSFIVKNVDEEVMKKQAYERATHKFNTRVPTTIHYHKHLESCNEKCYVVLVPEKVD